ncbi:MAG TPA: glucoamylase family protein [Ignavibacteriaceae bacterium]|nr:glucoamylase family protein [Ignavibacteriaceae bacterium]
MKLVAVYFLFFSVSVLSQDYIFFTDSPNSIYYDPSFGFYNSPSVLALANETKFPVDTAIKYSGANSLRLRWKSVSGGDWGMAVAETGWVAHDVNLKDSITFYAYTSSSLDSSGLPSIFIEDISNNKSPKQKLSGFLKVLTKNSWIRVSIPLLPFKNNHGSADLTKIKTIYFGQDNADNILHTIYLDEIRMISAGDTDTTPPAIPLNLTATGYTINIFLKWTANTDSDLAGYRIYRSGGSSYEMIGSASKNSKTFSDFVGVPPKTFSYKISAFDLKGNESALSNEASATTISAPDSVLLDSVQHATFKYFWDYAHPVSGLSRERLGSGDICAIGGTGFGIMAILVGIERGFITRDQAVTRMLKILNFLSGTADKFHGAFPHWINGATGKVIPFSTKDDGGDLVETAYLIQGLLTARQYFNLSNSQEEEIRDLITSIWEGVEWDWYRRDSNNNFLYWHWSPDFQWEMNFPIIGYNETMITYLLAVASPTHPVPASLYHEGWAGSGYENGKTFYGIKLDVGPDYGGPLFFAHYSFLGFDPRNKKDAYTDYFVNNRNITLINRAHCIENPGKFLGYDSDTWGLTASDSPPPVYYMAHQPTDDNGTISPTAALSSFPYTPKESMDALKSFFYEYGSNLWGTYGFKDAFNLTQGWYADSYIAIDQGPIIIMIENYRSQLLWNNFMANPEIQPMMDAIGFRYDSTAVKVKEETEEKPLSFELYDNYPNPFNPSTNFGFRIGELGFVSLKIYDILGNEVATVVNEELSPGEYHFPFSISNLPLSSGVYFYTLHSGSFTKTKKFMILK